MTTRKRAAAHWIDTAIIVCLFLFAAAAPHSIAATQTAWLVGMLLWVVRFAFYPVPILHKSPLDYALLGFFILTGLSAFLSYEPMVSIGKLRAASLFTIVYLFAQNIPSRRVLRLLALTLVASCTINVLYTAGQRLVGRGVKIQRLTVESPLYAAGVRAGDTLLEVNGHKLNDPEDLINVLAIPDNQPAAVKAYRHELLPTFKVERGKLLDRSTSLESLGIGAWSRGRDWRASGFFGHYVTYAEVLQLILALTVGLLVSLPLKPTWVGALLLVALAGFCYSLMLTVTRASSLAFLISSAVILLLETSRRTLLTIGLVAIPLVLAGLFILQQKRNVSFFDQTDQSTTWRQTIWQEGFVLLVSKPRHLLVGVGMDSIKAHWREWGMFDHGRLPAGHMHSNILQIALERGVPTLIVWLLLLGLYARMLWRLNRQLARAQIDKGDARSDARGRRYLALGSWIDRGLVLGALGGLVGFHASGLVHYNWGDSEVAMIFYLLMGLSLVVQRQVHERLQGDTVGVAKTSGSFG
ncbi:MAG: O-antigen ligase family protein [Acidobacteria bacterium]|nr:O-antigen ligase family protein [Acidobacteriota bacterium]